MIDLPLSLANTRAIEAIELTIEITPIQVEINTEISLLLIVGKDIPCAGAKGVLISRDVCPCNKIRVGQELHVP